MAFGNEVTRSCGFWVETLPGLPEEMHQRGFVDLCVLIFFHEVSHISFRLWSKMFILEDLHALSKDQCDCDGLQLIVSRQALGDESTSVCSQRWPTSPVVSCQLMLDWGHQAHGAFLNIVHFSQHHAVAGVANCAAKFEAHLASFVKNLTPSNHFSWEVQNLCLRETDVEISLCLWSIWQKHYQESREWYDVWFTSSTAIPRLRQCVACFNLHPWCGGAKSEAHGGCHSGSMRREPFFWMRPFTHWAPGKECQRL